MVDERSRLAVDVAEKLFDGNASYHEHQNAVTAATEAIQWVTTHPSDDPMESEQWVAAARAALAVLVLLEKYSFKYARVGRIALSAIVPQHQVAEQAAQSRLIRDIFGNPFRPVTFDSAWRTANVLGLAQTIYDARAFDRMPILADALEDAGCTSAEILTHCRQPGDHVRGCWVVDLILGKE
jgi:hypothetical protein